MLALLLAPRLAGAAPSGDEPAPAITLTEADLGPVYNVANALSSRPSCSDHAVDVEAAHAFARAASLLEVAARHYPPRTSPRDDAAAHARKRLVLVDEAVQLYEQAYQCAPGVAQRHHLERALDLLDAAKQLIVTIDHLPPDAPELDLLAARRRQVAARRPLPPPPPPPLDMPPPRHKAAVEPDDEPVRGYARVRGRLVLRPEIGVGFGTVTNQGITLESVQEGNIGYLRKTSSFRGVHARLVAAARLTLGASERHAFIVGGALGIQQVAPLPNFEVGPLARSIIQGGLHFEFALHAHPRWFSFHPMLSVGAEVYSGGKKFGRPYLGPGLGLCIDRAVVCFNLGTSVSLAQLEDEDARIVRGQLGLAVDLMRIADRHHGS